MRVGVLADIHGNLPALEAVLDDLEGRGIDDLVILGDLVAKGPFPGEVLNRVRGLRAEVIRGNGDEQFGKGVPVWEDPERPRARDSVELYRWVAERLSRDDLAYLAGLPFSHTIFAGNRRALCVHACPENTTDLIFPFATDRELAERFFKEGSPVEALAGSTEGRGTPRGAGSDLSAVLYAHIHRPFVRYVVGKPLINVGSVGQPFDGDPRASYAILAFEGDGFSIALNRVAYDVEATVSQAARGGMPAVETYARMIRTASWPY